jgi:succinate dehydrogenase/fumarate reductase flavoprotein subunit
MESCEININGYLINCYNINTLIIGSGAAALNAAVSLHNFGMKDIMIATSGWGAGTSNNAGSDKQTFYKLSLSGKEPDSVVSMAEDLFNGKCMHGDIALCEAQGSVQSFLRLVELGVKFPRDKYGSFAGYKTDHDGRSRASSAGPYTSKQMFEALASEVKKKEIKVLNHHHCVTLLTNDDGSKVTGAVALNTEESDPRKAFVIFNAVNTVLGTGGPAGIYETSVYPSSQTGSTGMAFLAGATGQNLNESQFGIASVGFRWNLSGSYQQVIPKYISTDINGNDEKEFLNDHFPDFRTLTGAIFLKGYQWPFDPRKISGYGSSIIDILVDREINEKHRKVFIDYSANPTWEGKDIFSPENIGEEAFLYLKNSGALCGTPIERLKCLNPLAIELYKEHGIDLKNRRLQIAVCNQHNNGGLKGNIWWESDLKHLFPVGEVNGSHGVYRPGGSALNSGQTGSYRAAQYISKKYNEPARGINDFLKETEGQITNILDISEKWLSKPGLAETEKFFSGIRKRMSSAAGIIRDINKVKESVLQAHELTGIIRDSLGASSVTGLRECFRLVDHCITHYLYLSSIKHYIENGGSSRGSYIITRGSKNGLPALMEPELCDYTKDIENKIIETNYRNGQVSFRLERPVEIPDQELWFEKVWKEYLEDI